MGREDGSVLSGKRLAIEMRACGAELCDVEEPSVEPLVGRSIVRRGEGVG
jgi:hypothetical protein